MNIKCDVCLKDTFKNTGHYNRARKLGLKLFCSKKCFYESRRQHKSIEQKKIEKSIYDKKYRELNYEKMKPKRRAYFQKVYKQNPEKFKAIRQKRYNAHLEYLKRPEYKAWKKKYDREYRSKMFGEFSQAWIALMDLDFEIKKQMSHYEIKLKNNTLNKALQRSRNGKTKRSYT